MKHYICSCSYNNNRRALPHYRLQVNKNVNKRQTFGSRRKVRQRGQLPQEGVVDAQRWLPLVTLSSCGPLKPGQHQVLSLLRGLQN